MKRRLVAILTLAAGSLFCQPPKDVDGWNKIKWGMTVAQAKGALGDQASDPPDADAAPALPSKKTKTNASREEGKPNVNDPLSDRILIHDFKIGDMVTTVAIRSENGSDVISGVEIRCGVAFPPGFKSPSPSEKDKFALIKQLLMEKYGAPISEEHHPPSESKAVWIFPSTSITLLWADTSGMLRAGLVGSVTISYKMLNKKDVL